MRQKILYSLSGFLLFLIISLKLQAQGRSNGLTPLHFNSIRFHDMEFSELKKTEGDKNAMQKLKQAHKTCEGGEEIGEKWRSFHYQDGLSVYFNGLSEGQIPTITHIEAISITIQDKKAVLGDHISILGEDLIISNKNGESDFYSFTLGNSDCCFVLIEVNNKKNEIVKITYNVQT